MKIEARLFYDAYQRYGKVAATDVKAFMAEKDFAAMKADMKSKISTTQEGQTTVFLKTTAAKTKAIMKQTVSPDEVQTIIDEWVDTKAYEKLLDQCLQYVFDKLAGAV